MPSDCQKQPNAKGSNSKVCKTDRHELAPSQRAQAHALYLWGKKSQGYIAHLLLGDRIKVSTVSRVVRLVPKRANELKCDLDDNRVFLDRPGRGSRPRPIDQEPKSIVEIRYDCTIRTRVDSLASQSQNSLNPSCPSSILRPTGIFSTIRISLHHHMIQGCGFGFLTSG